MKRVAVCVILFLAISSLMGCDIFVDKSEESEAGSFNIAYDTERIVNIDLSLIDEDFALGEAMDRFGPSRPTELSVMYPIQRSWRISETEILYIIFKTDDFEEFEQKFLDDEFMLPSETRQYVDGIEVMTENEKKVLNEWLRNFEATYAYVLCNGEITVIFDRD